MKRSEVLYPYSSRFSLSQLYQSPSTQYTAPIRHFLRSTDHRHCISKTEADYMAMNQSFNALTYNIFYHSITGRKIFVSFFFA